MTMKHACILALVLASCYRGPAQQTASGPAPAGKKKQKRPGVNEWFIPASGKAPVDLAGTAAAGLSFTEFRRGRFRVWHARAVPGDKAGAIWRAVVGKGDLIALLVPDTVFDEGYHGQFINAGGAVERERALPLAQALLVREKQLGERAGRMRAALASAAPDLGFKHDIEAAEQMAAEGEADPEGRPFDVALTVFRGPVEDVTPFLVSGAGLEPRPAELAAALRHWRDRYGAVPRRWNREHALELAVDHPPKALAELREVAWQFYLMCPAAPGAVTIENEPPDELLVRVGQRIWQCGWHVQ
jgi:hypothetical protein